MSETARGTFEVDITPGVPEVDGEVNRFDFAKEFAGDLSAAGRGVMFSCGDPRSGDAGYVAIETVRGRLGDRHGGFALQQLGQMHDGEQTLTYRIVPGSGNGQLTGIVGDLDLKIDADGTHHYALTYDV